MWGGGRSGWGGGERGGEEEPGGCREKAWARRVIPGCQCLCTAALEAPSPPAAAAGPHLNSTARSPASSRASTTFVKAWLAPAVIMTSYCKQGAGGGSLTEVGV